MSEDKLHKTFQAMAQGRVDYTVKVEHQEMDEFSSMMVIYGTEEAIYITRQQAMDFFGLKQETKMELTAQNVNIIIKDCLFKTGEDTTSHVKVEGIRATFGFHPLRLAKHEEDVRSMFEQIHDNFRQSKGGGWTFLNMCMTKDDVQWGEHTSVESLCVLGIALGLSKFLLPRELWSSLPGGMPYVIYLDDPEESKEAIKMKSSMTNTFDALCSKCKGSGYRNGGDGSHNRMGEPPLICNGCHGSGREKDAS